MPPSSTGDVGRTVGLVGRMGKHIAINRESSGSSRDYNKNNREGAGGQN